MGNAALSLPPLASIHDVPCYQATPWSINNVNCNCHLKKPEKLYNLFKKFRYLCMWKVTDFFKGKHKHVYMWLDSQELSQFTQELKSNLKPNINDTLMHALSRNIKYVAIDSRFAFTNLLEIFTYHIV